MIDCMRLELNLPTIKEKIEEMSVIATMKHIKSVGGERLSNCVYDYNNKFRAFRHQGRKGYIKSLCEKIVSFDLMGECVHPNSVVRIPPWDEKQVHVSIHTLDKKKNSV